MFHQSLLFTDRNNLKGAERQSKVIESLDWAEANSYSRKEADKLQSMPKSLQIGNAGSSHSAKVIEMIGK